MSIARHKYTFLCVLCCSGARCCCPFNMKTMETHINPDRTSILKLVKCIITIESPTSKQSFSTIQNKTNKYLYGKKYKQEWQRRLKPASLILTVPKAITRTFSFFSFVFFYSVNVFDDCYNIRSFIICNLVSLYSHSDIKK